MRTLESLADGRLITFLGAVSVDFRHVLTCPTGSRI